MPTQPRQLQDLGEQRPFQFRDFKGMNATDSRTAIDDTEFSWLEGFIPIGKGQVTIVPGPGANLTTVSAGLSTLLGFLISWTPGFLSIKTHGEVTHIKDPHGMKEVVDAYGAG